MSYIDSNLIGDECVVYRARVTWLALIPWIVWGLLIPWIVWGQGLKPIGGLGFLLIPFGYLVLRSTEAVVTNKRLIAKTGIIMRNTIEIPIKKVSSLQVKQNISGRMFGYGSLIISDVGNTHAPIRNIDDPMLFRKRFFEAQAEAEVEAEITKTPSALRRASPKVEGMMDSVARSLEQLNLTLPVIVTYGDGMYTAECEALHLVTEARTQEALSEAVWELVPYMIERNNLPLEPTSIRLRFEFSQDQPQSSSPVNP